MATIPKVTPIVFFFLLAELVSPAARSQNLGKEEEKSAYAVVFLNRGHVTGGTQSNVGLFKRSSRDSLWKNMYHRNLLSFGMGIWNGASGNRYYLAAGNGLHRSSDGGKTWRVLTDWHTEEVLSVALDPADSAVIYIGTPFGVFKSTDDGRHWQKKMKGMKKWFVKTVLIDSKDRRTLYAVAEDDLYRSSNAGEQWTPLNVGFTDIQALAQLPLHPGYLLVGTEDNGIRVTTDNGKTWNEGKGLPNTAFYAITPSSHGRTIYAGGYKTGIWMSVDAGASWKLLWQSASIEAIFSISVHPGNPHHLMLGTSGQGVYESLDGGETWHAAGLQGCHVKQIELYP